VLCITSHNWWYGQPFSKRLGDVFHTAHGLLFVAGPVALWLLCGWDVLSLLNFSGEGPGRAAAGAYVVVCWAAGLVGLPAVTAARLLRPKPAALAATRSEVVDFARQLGYAPKGHGRRARSAALPFNEIFQVEFVEHTLRLPRLPAAWDGLTLLHLSDMHLCGTPDRTFWRAVMDRCAADPPDLVALTGDLAEGHAHLRLVVPVLGRLRWNVAAFAVFGNHDLWYDPPLLRRRLRRLGIRYLGNSWERLDVRGEPLVVIGHEGPWTRPAPDLSGCPAGPFRLLLSHTPDNVRWARRAGADLMLSGHVHGGQVRLPVFGSVLVPSRYGRRYDCGAFDEGPTLLYVSRGVGGDHPLRYFCRPEVIRFTLRRA
jgi:predicted MPP superfamily phosphohydrolase